MGRAIPAASSASRARRLPPAGRRRRYLPLAAAMLGALLLTHLFTRMPISLNGFLFQVEAYLSWPPQTRLIVPPVGQVRAATHRSPVAFDITLWEVDLDAVRRLLLSQNIQEIWEGWSLPSFPGVPSSPDNLDDALAAAVRHAAQWLLMRAGALGFAGGALGSLLTAGFLPARRWLLGGFLGLALSVSLVVPAYLTYDTQAFSRPRITGIMEAAPWLLEAARESLGNVEALGDRLRTIATNMYTLFEQIDQLGELGLPPADLIVLHVSDLHNNPAALDFVEAVARRFHVDFIIDTGDITDWATPVEAELINRIGALGLPYLVTPGNHESPLVIEKLRATPNVRVLQDELVTMMGLRIYGFTDPGAAFASPRAMSVEEAVARAQYIAAAVEELAEPVDLIAVHNHRTALALPDGLAQAVLFGHNHRLALDTSQGMIRVNAGTTGAAGIRGLQSHEAVPYSVVILYFSREPGEPDAEKPEPGPAPLRLAVIDTIRVAALPARSLTLERIVVSTPSAPGEQR